jgi:hypothetical protein
MKYKTGLILLSLAAAVWAAGVPDGYNGLAFGADTLALAAKYPPTEVHRFKLLKVPAESRKGVSVYKLVLKKGHVDSVKFYFADNRFAMAVEYYYPGEDQMQYAVKSATGRFGQFAGAGSSFWRRQGDHAIVITLRPDKVAMATFMHSGLAAEIRERADYARTPEILAVDREIQETQEALDSLNRK